MFHVEHSIEKKGKDMETNRFIKGDCLKVMRGLPASSISCIVTSPPYNIGLGSLPKLNLKQNGKKRKKAVFKNDYKDHDDKMDATEYIKWQRECLTEMMRLLSPDGVIFYNHKHKIKNGRLDRNESILEGFPLRQEIVWYRRTGYNFTRTHFVPVTESIYMIANPKFQMMRKSNTYTNVWDVGVQRNSSHPAPFPTEIPIRCINASIGADGEGIVLDPFSGSGTTAVAAERMGVQWIGIEKSQEYIDQAQARIAQERAQMQLL